MAGIDELSSAIGANKDAVEQANTGVAAAMSNVDELSGQFQGLGADDKVAGVEQVQQTLASAGTAIEAAQAQAEALRGLKGGTGGGVSAGGNGASGAVEKNAHAPAGGGSGGGDGPIEPPPRTPLSAADPGDADGPEDRTPLPTGDELLQPVDRRKGTNLFRRAVRNTDQVEDAAKTLDKNFESAWQSFYSEPSPASAQQNTVAQTQSSTNEISTAPPAPNVGAANAMMATFAAAVVTAKGVQQFGKFAKRIWRDEERGDEKP